MRPKITAFYIQFRHLSSRYILTQGVMGVNGTVLTDDLTQRLNDGVLHKIKTILEILGQVYWVISSWETTSYHQFKELCIVNPIIMARLPKTTDCESTPRICFNSKIYILRSGPEIYCQVYSIRSVFRKSWTVQLHFNFRFRPWKLPRNVQLRTLRIKPKIKPQLL